jgi:hypothetical protein
MINVLKIRHFVRVLPILWVGCISQFAEAQVLEITTTEGIIKFQLVENHFFIKNHLEAHFHQNTTDTVTVSGTVPNYMAFALSGIHKVRVNDSIVLQPCGPHYRGVLTAPIEIDFQGNRVIRLDAMMIVHGKTYTAAEVNSMHAEFKKNTSKELFIRLYDTLIKQRYTPLADSLKDRYGRANRAKIKQHSAEFIDSLASVFILPDFTPHEIAAYENRQGLPAMDGRYLIIATLYEGEDVLNRMMNSLVNKRGEFYWKLVNR